MNADTVPPRSITLPPRAASAGAARRFLVRGCAPHQDADMLEVAELLISELVTNAVMHGRGPVEVEVWCPPEDGMTAWIRDGGPGMPRRRFAGPDAEGGRGLALVDALSSRWGVTAGPNGKTVWFHLDAHPG